MIKKTRSYTKNIFFDESSNGISLITLIVTIIVILILTGVVVTIFVNNNPIDLVNDAVKEQMKNNVIDATILLEVNNQLNIANGKDYENITFNDIAEAVGKTETELKALGYTYVNGQIICDEEVIYNLYAIPGKLLTENMQYKDTNNDIVIIPKGFMISNISTEKTVNLGLVIIDDNGNEYVWVPVSDGVLNRIGWVDVSLASYSEIIPSELSDSVLMYKGFYIARYEAGVEGSSANSVLEDGTVKPLSQSNKNVWNYISWDADNDNSNEITTGAVTVAESMYPSEETTYGVVSTLCYGAQWDEALEFISTVDSTYAIDSYGKGNYTGALLKTGSNTDYMVNNIYDMAGNVNEWTMETYTSYCIVRGGNYYNSGSNIPASKRNNYNTKYSSDNVGFRIALYIK